MQFLIPFNKHPDIWIDYAQWHASADGSSSSGGGLASASSVLLRGVKALPKCILLRFALADNEELQGKVQEARVLYEEAAARMEADLSAAAAAGGGGGGGGGVGHDSFLSPDQGALVWIHYMKHLRRYERERPGDLMG